jgi:hypothetical protein
VAAALSAGLAILSGGGGLLGSHHKNAVAAEQSGIAAAQNQIESAMSDVMNGFKGGMIDASTAKLQLDTALQNFGSDTAGIRTGGQEFWPQAANGQSFPGVKGKCNAACVYWAMYADKIAQLKKQIDSTPQTVNQNTSQNAQVGLAPVSSGRAAPASSVTYTQTTPQTPGTSSGIPPVVLIAVGVVAVGLLIWAISSRGGH